MNLGVKPKEAAGPPLVVDLDGTLIRTDLLVELFFAYLGADLLRFLSLVSTLRLGKGWRFVLLIIRLMPSFIFNKLNI